MANDDKPKKNYTNRTRQIEYKIRLTEEEFQYLQMQKLLSGCRNRRDFILQLARKGVIVNANQLYAELSHEGNNLNQIAKRINTLGADQLNDPELHDRLMKTIEELEKLWQSLNP